MPAELVCSASDPAWLERRREGITATDIVTIAGLVTWDSPWALYHRKLGELPEIVQSDRMRLGSWLENNIVDAWRCENLDARDVSVGTDLYRSSARPWQLATSDRVIRRYVRDEPATVADLLTGVSMSGLLGGEPDGHYVADAVLECKTWDERQGKHEWGPDGSDQVPAKVRAQVLWQMDTLGVGTGHVAVVFLPSGEFRSYTIRHDSHGVGLGDILDCDMCAEVDGLRDLGFGFWSRILTRRPPDLDGLEVTTDALRYLHPAPGGQVELDGKIDPMLFDDYAADKKRADDAYRYVQNQVRAAMGDAHEATVDGRVVFRRTIGKRAGYTVAPSETDTLRRIGKDKD